MVRIRSDVLLINNKVQLVLEEITHFLRLELKIILEPILVVFVIKLSTFI